MDNKVKILVLATALFSILILGLGFIIFFVNFASKQNRKSIEYVLQGASRQMGDSIQYIEGSILSIRRNEELSQYLRGEKAVTGEVETQFNYAMDLFSDRNRNEKSEPFVQRAYLFNIRHQHVSSRYYPETEKSIITTHQFFAKTVREFEEIEKWYAFFPGSEEDTRILLIRIFDEDMEPIGTAALEMNLSHMAENFSSIERYAKSMWELGFYPIAENAPQVLVEYGKENIEDENLRDQAFVENRSLTSSQIDYFGKYSFGLYSYMIVNRSNIFYNVGFPAISLLSLSLIILLALGIYILILIRQIYQKELLAVRTEVKYLQSQLNPHFQYNVLAMLSIKAKQTGNEELAQSLKSYSNLMRGKIFKEKEIFVPLKEEISLILFYLQLQKNRYGDRLNYEVDYIPEELGECLVPKLIIEPLVENAVEHGIEPKEEGGTVGVHATIEKEMLQIIVEDDGVGFGSGKTEGHTGTSMENTKQLLKVLYPRKHDIEITSHGDTGTRIKIRIPIQYD